MLKTIGGNRTAFLFNTIGSAIGCGLVGYGAGSWCIGAGLFVCLYMLAERVEVFTATAVTETAQVLAAGLDEKLSQTAR